MSGNPLISIWTHPRLTVRSLVNQNPELHVTLLAMLAGIGEALSRASGRNAGDKISLPVILAVALFVGPLGGLFSLWLYSHLIRFTGTWLGGEAPREHLKTALAWAKVPAIAGLPLWGLQLMLVGGEIFQEEMPSLESNPGLATALLASGLIEMILGVWSIVLMCNTVAEVQGFNSAWKGLWNMILAGLALALPILLVVFLLFGIATMFKT